MKKEQDMAVSWLFYACFFIFWILSGFFTLKFSAGLMAALRGGKLKAV
jgi:uncharacterized membrane protein YciS (DUF1049 family)